MVLSLMLILEHVGYAYFFPLFTNFEKILSSASEICLYHNLKLLLEQRRLMIT